MLSNDITVAVVYLFQVYDKLLKQISQEKGKF
jgi:hypothetical protein